MKMASQFLLNLQHYYNGLNQGLLVLNRNLDILFANNWMQNRLPLTDVTRLHPVLGTYDMSFIQSLVKNTIRYRSSQIVSQAFHSWLIPMPDARFSDGLMRQTCMSSPIVCPETREAFALIQIKDESDAVLKTQKMWRMMDRLEKQARELTATNVELQQHREQLLHKSKMEAIGTLAGGIAHDFNNILGIILGNTEILMDDFSEKDSKYDRLNHIRDASLSAKEIIKQILAINKGASIEMGVINLAESVEESVRLLKSTIPAYIDIDIIKQGNCFMVNANPAKVQQMVFNLISNASHAIGEKMGRIEICITGKPASPNNANAGEKKQGQVVLSIQDTGPGIDPAIMAYIFDPYFTTKQVGKGSGLGLSIVLGIVNSHNAQISIKSEPDQGASFIIAFQMSQESVPPPGEKPENSLPKSAIRILFVDDEAMLTEMGKQMLTYQGYTVDTYNDPVMALENFRTGSRDYDLVITDMTMPSLSGLVLSRELKKIRDDIPIILCTGHNNLDDDSKYADFGISALVLKPFLRRELISVIEKVCIT
jgi:signal transduction histidine kinase